MLTRSDVREKRIHFTKGTSWFKSPGGTAASLPEVPHTEKGLAQLA